MKTTKIIQWVVFVVAVLLGTWGIIAGSVVIAGLVAPFYPPIIALLALIMIVGGSILWGFMLVHVWIWLAERGWFE